MTLSELEQIEGSLSECTPDVEEFWWGPGLEFANKRRREALNIIRREINKLKGENK